MEASWRHRPKYKSAGSAREKLRQGVIASLLQAAQLASSGIYRPPVQTPSGQVPGQLPGHLPQLPALLQGQLPGHPQQQGSRLLPQMPHASSISQVCSCWPASSRCDGLRLAWYMSSMLPALRRGTPWSALHLQATGHPATAADSLKLVAGLTLSSCTLIGTATRYRDGAAQQAARSAGYGS